MASITYEEIFESFLGEITDYDLAQLQESDADQLMTEYLHKAVYNMHVYALFSSLTLDDDTHMIDYEMAIKWNESADEGFIKNVLGKAMAYEWLSPRLNSVTNTMQFFGGKEQKYYSQSNHMEQLRALKDQLNIDIRALIENRSLLKNTYLEG